MWEGQRDLRWSMERLADEALDRAGIELDPRGFLVGLPSDGSAKQIVIEPTRRAFDLDGLDGLLVRADELFEAQDDPAAMPSDPAAQEHWRAALLEGCRRQTVVEALTEAARFDDRELFVGMSVVVGHYRVFPVLAVRSDRWSDLACLNRDEIGALPVDTSFPEAVINDVLRAASRELDRRTPVSLMGVDAGAILRSAADSFVNGVVTRTGLDGAHGLRDALDAVSAQTYEGRAGFGGIVLAAAGDADVEIDITFENPVSVGVPRSFRKALEMAGAGLRLVCDGRDIYGLGQLADSYDPVDERCFVVRIVGNGSWELWHDGTPYLRVDHGQPSLPTDLMDRDMFTDTVRRVFKSVTKQDIAGLWEMALACTRQTHGTMLVVHPDAHTEGERLLPKPRQSFRPG